MTCARSATASASSIRSCSAHLSAAWSRSPMPRATRRTLPKLVLISTDGRPEAAHLDRRVELFERFGGPEVGALARRRFLQVQGHTGEASLDAWRRLAMPLYFRIPRDPDMARRAVNRSDVLLWFSRPGGESHSFNHVSGSASDPVPDPGARRRRRSRCTRSKARPISQPPCRRIWCSSSGLQIAGHAVIPDAPERAMAAIRDFIARASNALAKRNRRPEGAG